MRKSSPYAMKLKRQGNHYNGAEYLNAIQRCRPYTAETIHGSWIEGTQSAADKAMILVRSAYVAIKNGQSPAGEYRDFDLLAHALGVSTLRAIDIAGPDDFDNPMLRILRDATHAMERCRERRLRIGAWGFDGPALDQVDAGIEIYETILQASSPAQMEEVTVRRVEILAARRAQGVTA